MPASPDYKLIVLLLIAVFGEMYNILSSRVFFPTGSLIVGSSDETSRKTNSHEGTDASPSSQNSYRHTDVIYGHVHMAKTGGTYLNGFLANNYERVCGHKGYSYDAYQANERFIKDPVANKMRGDRYTRDRVDYGIIREIGFEDCDYISNERPSKFWIQFNNFHNTTMELHLPCRNPIDHLMSQCNYQGLDFNCQQNMTDKKFTKNVQRCLVMMNRYNDTLKNLKNINLKCYNFRQQFTGYIDYISSKLQPRRFVSKYKQRETNRPRVKEKECIWKDEGLMQRVRDYLVNNVDYYRHCDQCIGSDDDLTKDLI